MIEVSRAFKDNIYGQERLLKAKVSFEIVNVEAYTDATLSGAVESEISRRSQMINRRRDMTEKYATFEPNYFMLDGTYHLPPKTTDGNSEVGFWSEELSDESGAFVNSQVLRVNFASPHDSLGLMITFDRLANEYATDFVLNVYDSAGVLITREDVVGHTSPTYILDKPLTGYTSIILTVLKWSNPKRRVRIVEIDLGLVKEYSGETLISLKVVEEVDLLASSVPSNEMEFSLDNSDNLFNLLNPNGIYHYLKQNQPMNAELGLELEDGSVEYVKMGRYFLNEWIVDEGGMTATFIGRDRFTQLDTLDYTNLLQNTTLYDLAVDIFAQAGITDYVIHEDLKLITTVGFNEVIKAREALQMIAIAGRAVIRQDRYGFIIIDEIEQLAFETGYMVFAGPDTYTGMTTPSVTQDYNFQAITFENAFETPQVKLAPAVTHLIFKLKSGETTYDYKVVNAQVKSGQGYEINNPLINTEAQALKVAEYMFREYSFIAEYFVNWRQNPALETGDILFIEDSFGSKKKARITKNEFNYTGYLDGTSEAKGGV